MIWLPHWPRIGEITSMKLGLDRMLTLLELLGNPQEKIPSVIHIAGTNGKGSTTAFAKSILESSGMKVHVFTSPHLERFNERIVLSGSEIDDGFLYSLLEECRLIVEKHGLEISFFEGITAAAFLAFSRVPADATILEVGLGGRLDATNVIKESLVSIITPISYDHMNVLGDTLTQIASEKCGVMRAGGVCVSSMQPEEVEYMIERCAEQIGTRLIRFEYDYGVFAEDDLMIYKSKDLDLKLDPPALPGYHQFINAAATIAALREVYGNKISAEIISKGLANVKWKGRLQRIISGAVFGYVPREWQVWLDCAHNAAGAFTLGAWLNEQEDMDTYLIFSMTRNRDVNEFLAHIPKLKAVVCTNIKSEPLAYKGAQIPALITDQNLRSKCLVAENIDEAIEKIIKHNSGTNKVRIIVSGSMYLVSDFFKCNSCV